MLRLSGSRGFHDNDCPFVLFLFFGVIRYGVLEMVTYSEEFHRAFFLSFVLGAGHDIGLSRV